MDINIDLKATFKKSLQLMILWEWHKMKISVKLAAAMKTNCGAFYLEVEHRAHWTQVCLDINKFDKRSISSGWLFVTGEFVWLRKIIRFIVKVLELLTRLNA